MACKTLCLQNAQLPSLSSNVGSDIVIRAGKIVEIGEGLSGDVNFDADGLTALPGLIDIHTHGISTYSAIDASLIRIAEIEAEKGATLFFPTLFGPSDALIDSMVRLLRETDNLKATPNVGGFRLESPYLAKTGAGLGSDLAPIDDKTTNALLAAGKGYIKIWDISPELPYACETIHALSQQGVLCSMAHTNADIETAEKAIDAGMRLATHLFDTFSLPEITEQGVYPAGLTDYLLMEDRIACEIIPDGTHVHPLLIKKTLRCKPADKTVFITDSNLGAGLEAGVYTLPGGWGDVSITDPYNGVRIIHRDYCLAGSALTPLDGLRYSIDRLGLDLAAASVLHSDNAAQLLGLKKGRIAVDYDADIILLDDSLMLKHTISGGEFLYSSETRV